MKKLALALALVCCAAQTFAFVYSNKELGFTATFPDGLTNVPSPAQVLGPKYLVSLVNTRPTKANPIVEGISLGDLGGVLLPDDLITNLPSTASLQKAAWKGFNLQVVRALETVRGHQLVNFNVQIPLKPHAVQLRVSGVVSDELQLRSDMDTILASVEGPTNWVTSIEVGALGPNLLCIFVGVFALLVGTLRISPHYGLADSDARVAGFFILLAGLGLPYVYKIVPVPMYLHRLGFNYVGVLAALVALNFIFVVGIVVLLVEYHGNIYAQDANPLAYVPGVATPKPSKTEQKVVRGPLNATCPLCRTPVSSGDVTCPNCHADLARWKEHATT